MVRAEMVLAPTLPFKTVQTADKYPKGQSRGRQWKHLRHLLQAADASSMPPDHPNCEHLPSALLLRLDTPIRVLLDDYCSIIVRCGRA